MPAAVTFAVDDVHPARHPLPELEGRLVLAQTLGDPPEACSDPGALLQPVDTHPLVTAVHLAFSEHRPLVLSSDAIWLTIAQGLAQHINLHAQELRPDLVRHQGRKTLTVTHPALERDANRIPWPQVVDGFARQIGEQAQGLAELFLCDFSTSGPVERLASQVALMDAVQRYFDYVPMCICGIPYITLLGTLADWQRIRERAERLGWYGMEFWMRYLVPLCDHFVRAYQGAVDLAHWRSIYKLRHAYGGDDINGWICQLFPYLKDPVTGAYRRRNPMLCDGAVPPLDTPPGDLSSASKGVLGPLDQAARWPFRRRRAGEEQEVPGFPDSAPAIRSESLPLGLSRAPFIWVQADTGESRHMELCAGFVGVAQDPQTLALRPQLGWAVRPAPPMDAILQRLRREHAVREPAAVPESLPEDMRYSARPADLIRFYAEFDGATLYPGEGPACRILPQAELQFFPPPKEEKDGSLHVRSEWLRFADLPDGSCLLIGMGSVAGRQRTCPCCTALPMVPGAARGCASPARSPSSWSGHSAERHCTSCDPDFTARMWCP